MERVYKPTRVVTYYSTSDRLDNLFANQSLKPQGQTSVPKYRMLLMASVMQKTL
ncbi:MAG TPA: hypothetical protein VJC07_03655 [Candidatus Nanoarchaeia archaeon]|nr:hypothetical protein [Candidatus Nanoarchaeia archaeon]